MARLNYISNAEFVPMSMQDLLVPLTLYKEAFEKSEAEYKDLTTKSGAFAYLSQMAPEGSKARAIYEKYANDLKMQADDIAQNGLSMSNRSALTSLGQRYSSEIGMLEMAQKAMDEHKKAWMAQRANDPSMLFATNTFNLDDYLFGATPNMYSVSGDSLYKKGMAAGASASAKLFNAGYGGDTLGGYYSKYVKVYGYSPLAIAKFREDMSTIPELRQLVLDGLYANGVPQNLKGDDLRRAEMQYLNGVIDGAVYKEEHDLKQNLGVLTAKEADDSRRAWAQMAIAEKWKEKEYNLQLAALNGAGGSDDSGDYPEYVFSAKELEKEEGNIKKFDKYFTKNERTGEIKLTEEGLKAYNRGGSDETGFMPIPGAPSYPVLKKGYGNENVMTFARFVDTVLGGKDDMASKHYDTLGNKFAEYKKRYNDAKRRVRYRMPFSPDSYKANKDIVLSQMGDYLYRADMGAEDTSYKEGEKLSKEEFNKDDYTLIGSTYGPWGETLMIKDKNGDVKHYISPIINAFNEKPTAEAMEVLQQIEQMRRDIEDGKINVPQEQIAQIDAMYKAARQKAMLHHSQKWSTSKTEPIKFNSNYGN